MTTNDLPKILAHLNRALCDHTQRIAVSGKPGTFTGELTSRVIQLNSDIRGLIDDINEELRIQRMESDLETFADSPSLQDSLGEMPSYSN